MENIELVINIDKETYNDIKRGKIYSSFRDVPLESVNAIANGKPLTEEMIGEEDASKIIGERFKEFINTQGYDPYEVAVLCSEVLKENGISYKSNKYVVGVRLFEKSEDNE